MDEYYYPLEPEPENTEPEKPKSKYLGIIKNIVVFASWLFPLGIGFTVGVTAYQSYSVNLNTLFVYERLSAYIFMYAGAAAFVIRLLEWGHEKIAYDRYKLVYLREPIEPGMWLLGLIVSMLAIYCFACEIYLLFNGHIFYWF
jgi:hypothetical protein